MNCECCEFEQTQVEEIVAAASATPQAPSLDPVAKEHVADAWPALVEEAKVAEAPQAKLAAINSFAKVFEVSVANLAGDLMGIEFFAAEGGGVDYLLASEVKSGPVDIWNKAQAERSTQLKPYDRILAVNGEKGTADALRTKLKQLGDLTIAVERPRLLQFKIERSSAAAEEPLGLPLKFWSNGPGLTIEDIHASSVVGKYMEAADPAKRVRKGDLLVMRSGRHVRPTSQAEADAVVSELNLTTPLFLSLLFRSYLA